MCGNWGLIKVSLPKTVCLASSYSPCPKKAGGRARGMIPSRCEFSKTTGIRDKHERVTRLPLLHTPHLVFLPTKDNVNLINKSTEVKGWTYL